jgi:hypothetical protein
VLANAHTTLATGIPRLQRAALSVIMRSLTSSNPAESYLALALNNEPGVVVGGLTGHVSSVVCICCFQVTLVLVVLIQPVLQPNYIHATHVQAAWQCQAGRLLRLCCSLIGSPAPGPGGVMSPSDGVLDAASLRIATVLLSPGQWKCSGAAGQWEAGHSLPKGMCLVMPVPDLMSHTLYLNCIVPSATPQQPLHWQ